MPISRPVGASLAFSLMALGLAHCVADAPVDATQTDAGGTDGSMSEAGACGADTVACGGKCVAVMSVAK